MKVFQNFWPVMTLLVWFIKNTLCQHRGFCDGNVPVVKVCTNDILTSMKNVNIDTVSVPQYVNITCRCVISSNETKKNFVFVYTGNTDQTWFKLNEQKVKETHKDKIYDRADLFFTTNDSTKARGCLDIYTESGTRFNITCLPKLTDTTTDSVRPRTSYSSSGITSVTEAVVEPDRNKKSTNFITTHFPNSTSRSTTDTVTPRPSYSPSGITSVTEAVLEPGRNSESKTDIILPIVATIATVVCIAGVVALVVVCRRRLLADKQKSETSTTVVEKEKEDEYYMTENLLYNATDAEPNMPNAEREYHYIEAENQDVNMLDCQYESIPDSPEISQFQDNLNNAELHYDYTTCVSLKENQSNVST